MKTLFRFTIYSLIALLLTACGGGGKEEPNKIRLGTIAGPETEIMEVAKQVAKKKYGLDVEIVQFTDYVQPNQALADGSIDANAFQHKEYLEQTIAAKKYPLSIIGKTFVYPMGLYSKKFYTLVYLTDNSSIAIPNDPSNEARALLLLQKAGLIKLKDGGSTKSTINDILRNPRLLSIHTLDAAQLPRSLQDISLAAINSNYAIAAGLSPEKNALFLEDKSSPYANVVVVRTVDKDKKKFQQLISSIHSKEVVEKAKKLFGENAIPAW